VWESLDRRFIVSVTPQWLRSDMDYGGDRCFVKCEQIPVDSGTKSHNRLEPRPDDAYPWVDIRYADGSGRLEWAAGTEGTEVVPRKEWVTGRVELLVYDRRVGGALSVRVNIDAASCACLSGCAAARDPTPKKRARRASHPPVTCGNHHPLTHALSPRRRSLS